MLLYPDREKTFQRSLLRPRSIAELFTTKPLAIVSQTSAEIADNPNNVKSHREFVFFFRQLGYDSHKVAKTSSISNCVKAACRIFTQGSVFGTKNCAGANKPIAYLLRLADCKRPLTRSVSGLAKASRSDLDRFFVMLIRWRCNFVSSCNKCVILFACYRQPGSNLGGKTYTDILDDEVIVLLGF